MLRILVLGSNSFSGSHFVNQCLLSGFKVFGVSRSKEPNDIFLPYKWDLKKLNSTIPELKHFQFKSIDLNKEIEVLKKVINEFQPEIIVNFASQGMVAESWLNPSHWYQTNLMSQVTLHEFLRKKAFLKKYVHVTTPEVYGSTDGGWIKENFNFAPSTPYAVSRASCDLHLMSFFKAYDFPVVFTRSANVYGPGQQLYRIIPRAFLSARTGKPMELHGGGKSIRSFIHINDVVKATLKIALKAEPGTSWHISSNTSISIYNLVQKIFDLTNSKFGELVNPVDDRLGKDQNYLLSSDKLRSSFNWSDEIDLDLGLEDTLLWINQNLGILKNLPWNYEHKV